MTQRKAEREDQLLATATRLFPEKGYPMTSLQHLADTLDTHKDHLCYIDRKDKLRCQLLERTTLFLASDIGEIYAADLSLTENSTTPWRTTPRPRSTTWT